MGLAMLSLETFFDGFEPRRWWRWARQHPGTMLLGAMVLAVLVVPYPWGKGRPAADLEADETPLFI